MIRFTYDGKDYALGFNRKTVAMTERRGFSVSRFADNPATQIPILFRGSFQMNHSNTKDAKIEEIFDAIGERGELINELVSEYVDVVNVTINGDKEQSENLIKWSAD